MKTRQKIKSLMLLNIVKIFRRNRREKEEKKDIAPD